MLRQRSGCVDGNGRIGEAVNDEDSILDVDWVFAGVGDGSGWLEEFQQCFVLSDGFLRFSFDSSRSLGESVGPHWAVDMAGILTENMPSRTMKPWMIPARCHGGTNSHSGQPRPLRISEFQCVRVVRRHENTDMSPSNLSRTLFAIAMSCSLVVVTSAGASEDPSRSEVLAAMRRATEFFRSEVADQGAYVWRCSADLIKREGEGQAKSTTAWVQPPGLPSVGQAFLNAYQSTHDSFYLESSREAANALVRGQLRSGGWDYRIEYNPVDRQRYSYRVEEQDGERLRNVTTLDDDTTQAALRFLMQFDRAVSFKEVAVHETVEYALQQLLAAQYPNGAWPQRFSSIAQADEFPVLKAGFPEKWSRSFPGQDYRAMYTLNDNTLADMIRTMLEASEIYADQRCRRSAGRGGKFLILAQMPSPQPAWAQQYDRKMHPAWARKFEPPAVTGGESQGVIDTLMDLYVHTKGREFLKPIPAALDYLKRSQLPDGRLARFYELRTNRPLYFTTRYELTYDAGDLPTHYSFIVTSRVAALERRYNELLHEADRPKSQSPRVPASQVREVIDAMDDRGAWVTVGRLRTWSGTNDTDVIESRIFIRNLRLLADYVAALPPGH